MKRVIVLFFVLVFIIACDPKTDSTETKGNDPQDKQNVENTNSNEPAIVEITEEWGNTMCPVMPDDGVDKEKFVVYEGKKVYFCCNDCIEKFEKDPKKYHDFLAKAEKK
ncbi:YHS domain-containing protein [Candidatus Uabimicrobium sp. HlEnr_7]|uniref:YHS domain-containing protein n=1 Tax=Candidatus Uabimicrobium helgolandensis TaxID=3095367 RepID=UPI0035579352